MRLGRRGYPLSGLTLHLSFQLHLEPLFLCSRDDANDVSQKEDGSDLHQLQLERKMRYKQVNAERFIPPIPLGFFILTYDTPYPTLPKCSRGSDGI